MTNKEAQIALANLKRYISGGGTVDRVTNKAIDMAIEVLEKPEPHWIPVSERLPEETGGYLTTTMYGDVFCDHWQSCNFDRTEIVIAWMPMPKPYKEGEQE